jgi:hypothetical protein
VGGGRAQARSRGGAPGSVLISLCSDGSTFTVTWQRARLDAPITQRRPAGSAPSTRASWLSSRGHGSISRSAGPTSSWRRGWVNYESLHRKVLCGPAVDGGAARCFECGPSPDLGVDGS